MYYIKAFLQQKKAVESNSQCAYTHDQEFSYASTSSKKSLTLNRFLPQGGPIAFSLGSAYTKE